MSSEYHQVNKYCDKGWYFPKMTLLEATNLLAAQTTGGVFLVRDSLAVKGNYVLSVRDHNSCIRHYMLHQVVSFSRGNMIRLEDMIFPDLEYLLDYYHKNPLDGVHNILLERPPYVKYQFGGSAV